MAEGESGQEVEGDRREAHPPREASENPEGEDDRPEFDEHGCGVVHGLLSSGDQFGDGVHAFAGPDDDEAVADREAEVGGRRGHGGGPAQHGDDGGPGPGAGLGVAEGAAGVRRALGDGDVLGDQVDLPVLEMGDRVGVSSGTSAAASCGSSGAASRQLSSSSGSWKARMRRPSWWTTTER